ncbi:hypothetical protein PPTG_24820 [Phytophthora nicotianae INRA-310]|uniref:Uncharacterized protein n=1 Tax=Phytophthora nicotianae (strain INRA-310) TaxID=761204 RepID=W2PAY5_PHYN3|nr:hypothetical protein PPTG_24820 [Phytophthora nicotianae INRA-310]ETM97805.1 hypothetical protein PPTG_24820 [Phytophthora nicotianae INRA-310]
MLELKLPSRITTPRMRVRLWWNQRVVTELQRDAQRLKLPECRKFQMMMSLRMMNPTPWYMRPQVALWNVWNRNMRESCRRTMKKP